MKKLIFAAIMLISAVAAAAGAPSTTTLRASESGSFKLLDGVALNATAATRTITVTLGSGDARWSKLVLGVDHTNSAATDVTITPTVSFDCSTYFSPQSGAVSAGTRTLSDLSDVKAVSGDASFAVEYDVRGYRCAKFVFSGTSAGGSDLVDVYATAVVGY